MHALNKMFKKGGGSMYLNTEKFSNLVEARFGGSYTKCADALNLAPSTVWRVVKGDNKAGMKLLTNLIQYCSINNLNYNDYIFLEQSLSANNKM